MEQKIYTTEEVIEEELHKLDGMEVNIEFKYSEGHYFDNSKPDRIIEAIRRVCKEEDLMECNSEQRRNCFVTSFVESTNEYKELVGKRNKLNRQISTLKKATLKEE